MNTEYALFAARWKRGHPGQSELHCRIAHVRFQARLRARESLVRDMACDGVPDSVIATRLYLTLKDVQADRQQIEELEKLYCDIEIEGEN